MDSEFSLSKRKKCLEIQRNLFPIAVRETTIGKVIEKITQSSVILYTFETPIFLHLCTFKPPILYIAIQLC